MYILRVELIKLRGNGGCNYGKENRVRKMCVNQNHHLKIQQ